LPRLSEERECIRYRNGEGGKMPMVMKGAFSNSRKILLGTFLASAHIGYSCGRSRRNHRF
jgi:hypothetical protein